MFISGYANTENVFYCLNIIVVKRHCEWYNYVVLIKEILKKIINLSLIQGKFPDSLKIAKFVPVFIQGVHMLCTNYCPISVLPAAA